MQKSWFSIYLSVSTRNRPCCFLGAVNVVWPCVHREGIWTSRGIRCRCMVSVTPWRLFFQERDPGIPGTAGRIVFRISLEHSGREKLLGLAGNGTARFVCLSAASQSLYALHYRGRGVYRDVCRGNWPTHIPNVSLCLGSHCRVSPLTCLSGFNPTWTGHSLYRLTTRVLLSHLLLSAACI